MGFFKSKTQSRAVAPTQPVWDTNPAPVDDDFGDPGMRTFPAALRSGDWAAARNVLLGLPSVSRVYAIDASDFNSNPPVAVAERWVAEAPDDGWGHLVLGSLLVSAAWEARGGGNAATVGGNDWDVFFTYLQRADPALWQAARLLPESPAPFTQLMSSGIGLQVPLEELTTRFDEGHRREHFHPPLVLRTLQMLCAKWHGSDEQMFAFARMVAAEADSGSGAIAALPMAHFEHLVQRATTDGLSTTEARKPLETIETRNELVAAAERSIYHADFVPDAFGLVAANKFLAAFYFGRHHQDTDRVLRLLAGRYGSSPFAYFGDVGRMARKCEVLTAEGLARTVTW